MSTTTVGNPAGMALDSAPGLRRKGAGWRELLVLDALFLAMCVTFILLAPAGSWRNRVMGVELWRNADPAAGYVIGSLYVFTPKIRIYVGHPGFTLQVVVGAMAQVVYQVQQIAGEKETFFDFWARNLRGLYILASLVTCALHIVSFHLLFAFAKRLAGDAWVAFAAVLAYATSFPVLFYLMRISPEPILVITFLLTMLAMWNVQERLEAGAWRAACGWTMLGAAASILAIYSKIHLAAPLPLLACAQLLLQKSSTGERGRAGMRPRLALAGVFVLTSAAVFLAGTVKVKWRWFFRWWTLYAPGHTQIDVNSKYATDLGPLKGLWVALTHNISQYVPGLTPAGLFVIANGLFVLLAIIGLVWYWRRNPQARRLIIWPVLYCVLVTPVVLYRGSWHYLFIHLAVGAAPAAMLIRDLLQKWAPLPRLRGSAATIAVVLLMHSASIIFFLSGKLDDVRNYRKGPRVYYDALWKLEKGQHVAIVNHNEPMTVPTIVYGLTSKWILGAKELNQSLTERFLEVEGEEMLTPQFMREQRIGAVVREPGELRRNKQVGDESE